MTVKGVEIDMEINYHNRIFRTLANSIDEEAATVFRYEQNGDIVTATYEGGYILHGNLIAVMDELGCLDMRYQYIDVGYNIITGTCHTTPNILGDGRLRLYERWQQTSGSMKKGHTILEEITSEEDDM